MTPLQSIVAAGTKLWLDSVDPDEIAKNRAIGATGATSNPIIISGLLKTGRWDSDIKALMAKGHDDEAIAWAMTDKLVGDAQKVFEGVWAETKCNDGWVSFELDPLLEDKECKLSTEERSKKYVELAKHYSAGHKNRMIKVPATPGGLGALEEIVAAGIALNCTLIFSQRQYEIARDAAHRGAKKAADKNKVKTVYSIFVSRVDAYTAKKVPDLVHAAQGMVGIVNAKQLWALNQEFWKDKGFPLQQEIIFASTGTKTKAEDPWKYVEALCGADIETNPPGTNNAVQESGLLFHKRVHKMPQKEVLDDIAAKVNMTQLEETLMSEGLAAFADPHKDLIKLIKSKRETLKA